MESLQNDKSHSVYKKKGYSNNSERKNKTSKCGVYFNQDTQDAILRYNSSDNSIERNKIYNTYIDKPFNKLVENIIHTFKFYNFDSYEQIKNDTVAFMVEKMSKYNNPERGKAYSYFSIVAKNYLIAHHNGNYKYSSTKDDVLKVDNEKYTTMHRVFDGESKVPENTLSKFINWFADYFYYHIGDFFPDSLYYKYEILIANAIIDILREHNNIDIVNKKAFYVLIRNTVGVKIPANKIPRVIKIFKDSFYEMYHRYISTGKLYLDQFHNDFLYYPEEPYISNTEIYDDLYE